MGAVYTIWSALSLYQANRPPSLLTISIPLPFRVDSIIEATSLARAQLTHFSHSSESCSIIITILFLITVFTIINIVIIMLRHNSYIFLQLGELLCNNNNNIAVIIISVFIIIIINIVIMESHRCQREQT